MVMPSFFIYVENIKGKDVKKGKNMYHYDL